MEYYGVRGVIFYLDNFAILRIWLYTKMILSDKKAICTIQRTKIRKRGQLTIPSKMRKNWNMREGSEVMIEARNDELIIRPVISDPIKEGFGLFTILPFDP
ncbi:MAG TPA: AbrB/MazE/SpoVT family DNA-binding domain-containing protein [Methanosarcinaceae archaeon]|nr:AbrB/MazE/SpoVT family DNA-binding domain-containing protein [Methanosarcinaceae archaeon]